MQGEADRDISPAKAAAPAPKAEDGGRIFASPLARRIAADKGLDLSAIKGSGPRGRIVKADVENAKPGAAPAKADAAPAAAQAPAAAAPACAGRKLCQPSGKISRTGSSSCCGVLRGPSR